MAIPVTIATNGIGLPVRQVDGGAPVMQVTDGLGIPIVLSDLGAVPIVCARHPADAVAGIDRAEFIGCDVRDEAAVERERARVLRSERQLIRAFGDPAGTEGSR